MTQLLKLVDKICNYEMEAASIVEIIEWIRLGLETNEQTDAWTDKVKPVYSPSTLAGDNDVHK